MSTMGSLFREVCEVCTSKTEAGDAGTSYCKCFAVDTKCVRRAESRGLVHSKSAPEPNLKLHNRIPIPRVPQNFQTLAHKNPSY
mmetsp:Transcript_19810/g.49233  ORF Transcript_19810/g.49233 Transcript_19810/m.49233 type:complete len:84 (-) Transcript_19810:742-993(-)